MNKEDCYFLGYIAKTHGIKGDVSIKLDVDNPNEYSKLESIFLDIQGKLIPFFIDSITIKDKGFAAVKLEGIDTEPQASNLLHTEIFLPLSVLPPLKGNKFYFHEVIDFQVIDKDFGSVGTIKDVLDYPHQSVLQVMRDDKEILIPITDEIITHVDRVKKIVEVDTPIGLIELYL